MRGSSGEKGRGEERGARGRGGGEEREEWRRGWGTGGEGGVSVF